MRCITNELCLADVISKAHAHSHAHMVTDGGTVCCSTLLFWLQIVQSLGFEAANQEFPIYADRMPTQLLAYLRLSRLQDSGEIAKASHAATYQPVVDVTAGCMCAVTCAVTCGR